MNSIEISVIKMNACVWWPNFYKYVMTKKFSNSFFIGLCKLVYLATHITYVQSSLIRGFRGTSTVCASAPCSNWLSGSPHPKLNLRCGLAVFKCPSESICPIFDLTRIRYRTRRPMFKNINGHTFELSRLAGLLPSLTCQWYASICVQNCGNLVQFRGWCPGFGVATESWISIPPDFVTFLGCLCRRAC